MAVGLDVGTSFIIAAREAAQGTEYSEIRDAFIRLQPASPIAAKMMEKGLVGQKFFKDTDGSFVVVGKDAIERAIERHTSASRPMLRGVISARERDARRILKFIIGEVVGAPKVQGEKLAFSVPAQPVDQDGEKFDTAFHEDALKNDLAELGYAAAPLNEAEAICYSELDTDDYTGLALSFGAGMVNVCVMSSGEAVLKFSTTKSGDWIDQMAAAATGLPESVIQAEKEQGVFTLAHGGAFADRLIHPALISYYMRLVDYTVGVLVHELSRSSKLPKFSNPLPVIVSGGTSRADGFVDVFSAALKKQSLPFQIKEVRAAKDQLRAVARGCMIAAEII